MKKVGIMSMQRIYNYGSFLQGYALKRLIENTDSSVEVSFIDYIPGKPLIESGKKEETGFKRKISKLKEYSNVESSLINKVKFFNHKRTYGKRFFPILGITDNFNNDNDLDLLVIGSDEVFNCVQANTNVGYSRDLFGHNSKAKSIISYAGSFGNTTLEKIDEYNISSDLSSDFLKFDAVSVRDANSFDIVKKLGIDNPQINVDPVLAYDYMKLERDIPKSRLYDKKYMIVYGYSGRLSKKENSILKEYANSKGLKILCFGGVQGCCDEFIDCTPFELLAYFRDAESIVTDTFHGTIFSIINQKPFVTIIRKSLGAGYGNEEKLSYLLNIFGLANQRVDEMSLNMINKKLSANLEYSKVMNILADKRDEARLYLKKYI